MSPNSYECAAKSLIHQGPITPASRRGTRLARTLHGRGTAMLAATLLFAAFVIQLVPDVSDAARDLVRTIPLVCDARKSLLVPVRVNGLDVRPFLLDTGSSVTTIDERLISRLSLPPAGRIASATGFDPLVTAQLTIGPVTLPGAPVVVLNLRRF